MIAAVAYLEVGNLGLFDTIRVKATLPESFEDYQDKSFQTKSLESLMNSYVITEEGRLVEHRKYYEDHPTRKSLFLGKEFPEKILVHEAYIDQDYHGDIRFYDYDDEKRKFVEFEARFTHGSLEYIEPRERS